MLFPKRKPLRLSQFHYGPAYAYFVTICAKDKQPYFLNTSLAKNICDEINHLTKILTLTTYAYIIMPEHLHWLLSFEDPNLNLSKIMRLLKGHIIKEARSLKIEFCWQRSFYDHVLRREENIFQVAQYITENSLRRNLVKNLEDYSYWFVLGEK